MEGAEEAQGQDDGGSQEKGGGVRCQVGGPLLHRSCGCLDGDQVPEEQPSLDKREKTRPGEIGYVG